MKVTLRIGKGKQMTGKRYAEYIYLTKDFYLMYRYRYIHTHICMYMCTDV